MVHVDHRTALALTQPHHLVYVRQVLQQPYQEQAHSHGAVMARMADQMHHVQPLFAKMVSVVHRIMQTSIQRHHQIYVLSVQHQPLAEQAHGHGHVQELTEALQQIVMQIKQSMVSVVPRMA